MPGADVPEASEYSYYEYYEEVEVSQEEDVADALEEEKKAEP